MRFDRQAVAALLLCAAASLLSGPAPAQAQAQAYQITQVTQPVLHGEGPHWDCAQNVLYFVDITGKAVHRYDPATKEDKSILLDGPVTPVVPVMGSQRELAVGVGRDLLLVSVDWNAPGQKPQVSASRKLASIDGDKPNNRFNDGKADRRGRMWFGTMGAELSDGVVEVNKGAFFRFEASKDSRRGSERVDVHTVLPTVNISNGLAWNDLDTIMYYIDTPTRQVHAFDFDAERGELSNRRVVFDLRAHGLKGNPDGMTIDSAGNLWVALYNGWKVIHINPRTKELLQEIKMPVSKPSSVTFGGKNLDTLYVTTIRLHCTADDLQVEPHAGAVFAITGLNATGVPPGNHKAVIRR